jgi:hypothetical protein
MKYDDFSGSFLRPHSDWIMDTEIYCRRSAAFVAIGDWRAAASDLRRCGASAIWKDHATDQRWTKLGEREIDIDLWTLSATPQNRMEVWTRIQSPGTLGHELQQWQLDCGARQVRTEVSEVYDASGALQGTRRDPENWQAIVPESVGEVLAERLCAHA